MQIFVTGQKNLEHLSKDILDKEFVKSFGPIYIFQFILASCRVYVKDWFVTSPSLIQKLHTILSGIAILILDYITLSKYNLILVDNSTIYVLSTWVTALHTLTFICNIIHVRFLNGRENAEFVVKLQQIDRRMKIDSNKTITAMMWNGNMFSITWVLVIFGALLATAGTKKNISTLALLGIVYTQINLVTEIIFCSNIFTHFFIRAQFINSILFNYTKNRKVQYVSFSNNHLLRLFPTKAFMRHLAAETHNFTSSATDVYLKEILQGFAMFQVICKFQIFVFCCKLVASTLLTFEFVLFAAQNETVELTDSLTPAVFTLIDILVAFILVVSCEKFLREIQGIKRMSITVMSIHYDGVLREKAKKMLKLIEETPPRLSVYEMWELDAHVLLQMFMLVTSLIVTQLQFVFL